LQRADIPFVKRGGFKFLETAHVKDVLAHLRIVANPRDAVSWHRVILLLEGLGPRTAEDLVGHLAAPPPVAAAPHRLVTHPSHAAAPPPGRSGPWQQWCVRSLPTQYRRPKRWRRWWPSTCPCSVTSTARTSPSGKRTWSTSSPSPAATGAWPRSSPTWRSSHPRTAWATCSPPTSTRGS